MLIPKWPLVRHSLRWHLPYFEISHLIQSLELSCCSLTYLIRTDAKPLKLTCSSCTRTMLNRLPVVAILIVLVTACAPDETPVVDTMAEPVFTGSESCESCHQEQFAAWQGSHHQLAMQTASAATVLGDFSGTPVPYFETSATFTEHDGRFYATVEGPTGQLDEYEVTHTFGVAPLQQYLVNAAGGRKQALQFAWDAREKVGGGQRWFHLYPDEYVGPADSLHWSGRYFNWNIMCAECHSTNLEMAYDIESNSFDTTFAEISVGCEACHGPGSLHVEQANEASFDDNFGLLLDLNDRSGTSWVMNATTGIAELAPSRKVQLQPDACGRCHSRRSLIAEDYEYGKPLADTHLPSLLEERLYHADGRIHEEVYVYGSFLQSKMYAAGVTCSDCHEPHSGTLRAGPDPNDTCATCHLPAKFATANHSEENVGDCVSCHMPATTYMGVDDRRDHSFRLPETENDPNHYGAIIAAGRRGNANDALLAGINDPSIPGIARATMLTLLVPSDDIRIRDLLKRQLDSEDALVRIGALRALRQQPADVRLHHGSHLLRDPVRAVRVEAALTFIEDRDLLPLEDARAFNSAAEDYRQSAILLAAVPEVVLSLAEFERSLGNDDDAAQMYEHAIRIGADSAQAQHAYGLHLVRTEQNDDALAHLEKATRLDATEPQFIYVYGVALNSLGRPQDAIRVLQQALDKNPQHFDIAWALATIYRDTGDRGAARHVAEQLKVKFPDVQRVDALIRSLQD